MWLLGRLMFQVVVVDWRSTCCLHAAGGSPKHRWGGGGAIDRDGVEPMARCRVSSGRAGSRDQNGTMLSTGSVGHGQRQRESGLLGIA